MRQTRNDKWEMTRIVLQSAERDEEGAKEEEHRVRDERTTLTYFNSQTAFA